MAHNLVAREASDEHPLVIAAKKRIDDRTSPSAQKERDAKLEKFTRTPSTYRDHAINYLVRNRTFIIDSLLQECRDKKEGEKGNIIAFIVDKLLHPRISTRAKYKTDKQWETETSDDADHLSNFVHKHLKNALMSALPALITIESKKGTKGTPLIGGFVSLPHVDERPLVYQFGRFVPTNQPYVTTNYEHTSGYIGESLQGKTITKTGHSRVTSVSARDENVVINFLVAAGLAFPEEEITVELIVNRIAATIDSIRNNRPQKNRSYTTSYELMEPKATTHFHGKIGTYLYRQLEKPEHAIDQNERIDLTAENINEVIDDMITALSGVEMRYKQPRAVDMLPQFTDATRAKEAVARVAYREAITGTLDQPGIKADFLKEYSNARLEIRDIQAFSDQYKEAPHWLLDPRKLFKPSRAKLARNTIGTAPMNPTAERLYQAQLFLYCAFKRAEIDTKSQDKMRQSTGTINIEIIIDLAHRLHEAILNLESELTHLTEHTDIETLTREIGQLGNLMGYDQNSTELKALADEVTLQEHSRAEIEKLLK